QSFNSDNQQTGTGFAYDGNGSPTTYKGTTLTFDPENHLTGIGASWSATYRADGLRASKTASGTTTYYLYDGGEPVCEFNSSGTLIAYNVFAPDGLVARRKVAVPTWTEYTFDSQGSVAQRLDASQNIITSSYYDAYGVENTTGTPTDQFGYNGQSGYYLDRETGLYLCQNRYFDPAGGRWVTRDPIGYAGGINVYGYCGSGPVGASDRSGHGFSSLDGNPEDVEMAGELVKEGILGPGGLTRAAATAGTVAAAATMAEEDEPGIIEQGWTWFCRVGTQMHESIFDSFRGNPDYSVNQPVIEGSDLRPDIVNWVTRTVIEIKPYNPDAIEQGLAQAAEYARLLSQQLGIPFSFEVWPYEAPWTPPVGDPWTTGPGGIPWKGF
ncbi:MAG TPA: RHS repeat-associated core domain-containing protein, partial [Fimbriimonadaceae bacterium]|nr:RHS repeat-associated core domain-containing protein [Fimbriimonadaceae bacterium]